MKKTSRVRGDRRRLGLLGSGPGFGCKQMWSQMWRGRAWDSAEERARMGPADWSSRGLWGHLRRDSRGALEHLDGRGPPRPWPSGPCGHSTPSSLPACRPHVGTGGLAAGLQPDPEMTHAGPSLRNGRTSQEGKAEMSSSGQLLTQLLTLPVDGSQPHEGCRTSDKQPNEDPPLCPQ